MRYTVSPAGTVSLEWIPTTADVTVWASNDLTLDRALWTPFLIPGPSEGALIEKTTLESAPLATDRVFFFATSE